jgi:hypothetical protein
MVRNVPKYVRNNRHAKGEAGVVEAASRAMSWDFLSCPYPIERAAGGIL